MAKLAVDWSQAPKWADRWIMSCAGLSSPIAIWASERKDEGEDYLMVAPDFGETVALGRIVVAYRYGEDENLGKDLVPTTDLSIAP